MAKVCRTSIPKWTDSLCECTQLTFISRRILQLLCVCVNSSKQSKFSHLAHAVNSHHYYILWLMCPVYSPSSLFSAPPFSLLLCDCTGNICISHVLEAWFTCNTLWLFFTVPFIKFFRISYCTDHVKNFGLTNSLLGECWKSCMSGSSFPPQLNKWYWINRRACLGYSIHTIVLFFCRLLLCCHPLQENFWEGQPRSVIPWMYPLYGPWAI